MNQVITKRRCPRIRHVRKHRLFVDWSYKENQFRPVSNHQICARSSAELTDLLTKGSLPLNWQAVLQMSQIECFARSVAPVDPHSHRSCFATAAISQDSRHLARKDTPITVDFSNKYVGHEGDAARGNSWQSIEKWAVILVANSGIVVRFGSNLTIFQLKHHPFLDTISKSSLRAGMLSAMHTKGLFQIEDSPFEILKGSTSTCSTPIDE